MEGERPIRALIASGPELSGQVGSWAAARSRLATALRGALRTALLGAFVAGCGGDDGAGPEPEPEPGPAVDLDALFAPASAAEVQTVRDAWALRDPSATDVREEAASAYSLGGAPATLRVLSHATDAGRHYGAVIVADGAAPASLPVVVYAHGGDAGVGAAELQLLTLAVGEGAAGYVWVLPSFRSETLTTGTDSYTSTGAASPWDHDVDDALGLMDAALEATSAADAERIGVLGVSRGGGVALLMGVRDPRIDRIVEFFGPTDFLGPYARTLVEEALDGRPRPLPGLAILDQRFLQPLAAGTRTLAQVRLELVRRSAVLFAADLPLTQVHHGSQDAVVDVSQAESLREAFEALGRSGDEVHLYPGGSHSPLSLPGSIDRAVDFLSALRAAGVAAR